MRRAVKVAPQNPGIATLYCRYLHSQGRIEELAESEWVDSIRSSDDMTIIGRNSEDAYRITEAQLFRKVALAFHEDSLNRLKEGVEIISSSPKEWHLCNVASFLTAACVEMGAPDLVEESYSRRCEKCRACPSDNFPGITETMIGQAWMYADNFNKAVQLFEVAYDQDPDCTHLLHSYYWALDETGETNHAIKLAEKLREAQSDVPDHNYNLGLMCGKESAFGRARYYYESELEINPKHPFARENLIVNCLLEKDLNSADEYFGEWQESISFVLNGEIKDFESEEDSIHDIILAKRQAAVELIDYAKSNIESSTYLQDLINKNESGDIFIGSTVSIRPRVFSCSDLIDALQNPEKPHAKDVLFNMKLEQSGDYSMLALSLEEEIPHINDLNAGSKIALLEAEKRFRDERSGDTSLFIVGYCKSFESQLKVGVFDEYRRVCHDLFNLKEEIEKASASNALKQTIPFLKYLNRPLSEESHIELGGMARAIKLSCGKTAKRSEIMAMLRSFIENDLLIPNLCKPDTIEEIEKLAEVWRNPAAHSEIFGQDALSEVRKTLFKLFNIIQNRN